MLTGLHRAPCPGTRDYNPRYGEHRPSSPHIALRDAFTSDLWLRRGAGDGSFLPGGAHVSAGDVQAMFAVRLADIDGDGRADVLGAVGSGTFQPALATFSNRTYAPGGPLLDLGQRLDGGHWPIQVVSGSFTVGSSFSFTLAGALPSAPVFLVVGTGLLNAPFKGGTLMPLPQLITRPWVTSPQGTLQLAGTWTAGTPGLLAAFQFWLKDPGGPKGYAASSATQVVVP